LHTACCTLLRVLCCLVSLCACTCQCPRVTDCLLCACVFTPHRRILHPHMSSNQVRSASTQGTVMTLLPELDAQPPSIVVYSPTSTSYRLQSLSNLQPPRSPLTSLMSLTTHAHSLTTPVVIYSYALTT
jgi:hypothetical protein